MIRKADPPINTDFFDVRKFPTATFVSTQIRKQPGDKTTHILVGNLTMHGATQQIQIPCNIFWQGKKLVTQGSVVLQRSAFGMNFGAGQIRDEVPVTFNVVASAAAGG